MCRIDAVRPPKLRGIAPTTKTYFASGSGRSAGRGSSRGATSGARGGALGAFTTAGLGAGLLEPEAASHTRLARRTACLARDFSTAAAYRRGRAPPPIRGDGPGTSRRRTGRGMP
ncbi:hypothetical protein GCM10022197_20330 [Microlunatus spumicola]|uniref:Uncharacterized protein n=1 Tax=Microlunatus spumicola TaxID=81499 RepID=A0ABP6XDY8_9ACTN